jgi:hypothetical protein
MQKSAVPPSGDDAQSMAMSLFADSVELAGKIVLRADERLDRQMDTSGLFPWNCRGPGKSPGRKYMNSIFITPSRYWWRICPNMTVLPVWKR